MPPRRANFNFEKRQRELDKQKKKEEKRAKRAARSDERIPSTPDESNTAPVAGEEDPAAN